MPSLGRAGPARETFGDGIPMNDEYPWRAQPRYRVVLWMQRLCSLHLTAVLALVLVPPLAAAAGKPGFTVVTTSLLTLYIAKAWLLKSTGAPVRMSVRGTNVSFEDKQARRWYWRDVCWLRQPQPDSVVQYQR